MAAATFPDRIGFRAICTRALVYILLIGAIMQGVFYEALAGADQFSERGFTELLQSLLLLTAMALAIAVRSIDRQYIPEVSLLLIALLGASLIREQDAWLDNYVFDGAWEVLVSLLVLPILYVMIVRRQAFMVQLERLANTFAFGLFAAGFLTVYVFSRLYGRSELWKAILDDRYLRNFKAAAEEITELFGYFLLLIAMFEILLMIRRWHRSRAALLDSKAIQENSE